MDLLWEIFKENRKDFPLFVRLLGSKTKEDAASDSDIWVFLTEAWHY